MRLHNFFFHFAIGMMPFSYIWLTDIQNDDTICLHWVSANLMNQTSECLRCLSPLALFSEVASTMPPPSQQHTIQGYFYILKRNHPSCSFAPNTGLINKKLHIRYVTSAGKKKKKKVFPIFSDSTFPNKQRSQPVLLSVRESLTALVTLKPCVQQKKFLKPFLLRHICLWKKIIYPVVVTIFYLKLRTNI